MKKLLLILLGFGLALGIFGVVGFAYAQIQEPPEAGFEYANGEGYGFHGGMMGGRGGMMGFGWDEDETGPLHDYLFPAMAEAFGLTEEQTEAFEVARQTVQGIREDLSQEEIQDAMQQALTKAIENALADGAITEEQAERWLERIEQMDERLPGFMWGDPGMMWTGRRGFGSRHGMGNYRQGLVSGFRLGRQTMLNHEYLDAAIADELGISVEELQSIKEDQGFNLLDYAAEQGLSDEEFNALRLEIFTNAVNAALEDGAITQEQADWILERLQQFETGE